MNRVMMSLMLLLVAFGAAAQAQEVLVFTQRSRLLR
jgi:hypothetical protein